MENLLGATFPATQPHLCNEVKIHLMTHLLSAHLMELITGVRYIVVTNYQEGFKEL